MISLKSLTILAGGLTAMGLVAAVLTPIFAHPHGGSHKRASPAWEARRTEQDGIKKAGDAAAFKGDYRAAISDYQRLLKLDPNRVDAYLEIAKAYDRLGRSKEALDNFRLAWDTPRRFAFKIVSPFESLRYGQLALAAGDPATARRAFSRATEGAGEAGDGLSAQAEATATASLSTLQGLACASAIPGFTLESRFPVAKQAYELAPESPYVCCVFAGELCAMQQYKDSKAMYDRALRLSSGEARDKLAQYAKENGFLNTTRMITGTDAKGQSHSHQITIELKNEPFPKLPHLPRRPELPRNGPIQP